jgi:hypothetical protein
MQFRFGISLQYFGRFSYKLLLFVPHHHKILIGSEASEAVQVHKLVCHVPVQAISISKFKKRQAFVVHFSIISQGPKTHYIDFVNSICYIEHINAGCFSKIGHKLILAGIQCRMLQCHCYNFVHDVILRH